MPRLDVLETQMGKDVLFGRGCQKLFLERGQTNRKSVTCAEMCRTPEETHRVSTLSFTIPDDVLAALPVLVFGLQCKLSI